MARPSRYRRNATSVISKRRQLWTDICLGTFALVRVPAEERKEWSAEYPLEPGDDIIMELPGPGDTYFQLDITRLSALELDYIEAFFARAIAAARPIVERRDENAEQQRHDGIDTNPRIYRQVPQFIVRQGYE